MGQEAGQPAKIAVLGATNMDLVVSASLLPLPGETLRGDAFVMTPGGKGANQAVAAARMGARVTFVGRTGGRRLRTRASRRADS